jgi:glycosyltransferase involved in cell wall biosynthesis
MSAQAGPAGIQAERPPVTRRVAVAIPCHNEAATIARVVADFRAALPGAAIYVFDNNSSDGSGRLARSAGAEVLRENRQGKGYVMQAILERVDCDALVVVDGDDTYPAAEVQRLLEPLWEEEADMVVGTRLENATDESLRRLHRFGNRLIVAILNLLFGTRFRDVLSGYRAFSRRFLSQVPLVATGFDTEVDLTIQALEQGLVVREVPVSYRRRPEGSRSKLRTFSDGYRILLTIAVLLRDHRPLLAFGTCGAACLAVALGTGVLRLLVYAGIVALPAALLSGLLIWMTIVGGAFVGFGLVLNSINTRFREVHSLLRRSRPAAPGGPG